MRKIISFLSLAGMSAVLSFCANPESSLLKRSVQYAEEDTQLLKGFNKLENRTTSKPCLKQIGRREDELVIPDASDSFGQVVTYKITQIQTREDLEEHMDVSASASLNASVFGASGKMKFIQDNKIDRMAIYMLVSIEVLNPSRTARNIEYTDAAMKFLNANDFESFRKACGDEFIAGYSTGGSAYALVQLSTATREDRDAVEASLAVNSGFFSASGDLKSRLKEIVGKRDIYAKILKTAGSGVPVKSDIASVTALVENFTKEVATAPTIQKVVLRSYSTLPMNRIPNPADRVTRWNSIEELSDLYKEQRKWLENIQYVLANPSYYVYTAEKEVELKNALEVVHRNMNSLTATYESCNDLTRACLLPDIEFFYVELPAEQVQEKIPPIPDFAIYKEDAVCGARTTEFKEDASCGLETYSEVCGSNPKWGVDGNICGWDKGQKELQPTWYCPGEQDAACRKLGAGWKLDAFNEETDAKQNRCS
ncbi:MAG TPA: hypothetical protein VFO10_18025, partial [Oligoflexus sp.]|uniref:hypothetical protein n=1 Tax=Oligoflexus sp. TaxID=1971216 RepID=UPI002D7E4E98